LTPGRSKSPASKKFNTFTPLTRRDEEQKFKLSRNSSINYVEERGAGASESRASLDLDQGPGDARQKAKSTTKKKKKARRGKNQSMMSMMDRADLKLETEALAE